MLTFYLASLIFGGGLLAYGFIAGGESDSDHDFDADHDFDGGHDFDGDHDFDGGHDFDADHDVDSADAHTDQLAVSGNHNLDPSAVESVKWLSFRNITYFMSFFGLTGSIFTLIEVGFIPTLLASSLMGVFAWVVGYKFFKYLKNTETGEVLNVNQLVGKIATSTMNIQPNKVGKILCEHSGSSSELLARFNDENESQPIKKGDKVIIFSVQDGIPQIQKTDL